MTRRISGYDIAKRQTSAALREFVQADAAAETRMHCSIVKLIETAKVPGVVAIHCPNGGKRSKREAAIFKTMGVRAGVPDLIIWQPGGITRFIEIKTPRGIVSSAQIEFFNAMRRNGHECSVVRSLDEAAALLTEWGVIRCVRMAA